VSRWAATVAVAPVFGIIVLACLPSARAAAEATGNVVYQPPVDAPVTDVFRPPAQRWSAGNRGVDYGTTEGQVVRAAAPGQVVFAGQVGGSLHVVVLHADGIRTSYSFLSGISVHRGEQVVAGQPVGTAGTDLHFGARAGDAYVDPMVLLSSGTPRVHLVPEGLRVPQTASRERAGVVALLARLPSRLTSAGAAALDWARRTAAAVPALASAAGGGEIAAQVRALAAVRDELRAWAAELSTVPALPVRTALDVATAVRAWHALSAHCTPASAVPPPLGRRDVVVLVAGLGSSSDDASVFHVDTARLGYAPDDIVRFSYRGGTTEQRPYGPADTEVDLRESGRRLRELLEQLQQDHPGVPVDIVAHSQGGLVVRVALGDEYSRFDPRLPPLGTVVTIDTPHHGADLATVGESFGHAAIGSLVERVVGRLRPGIDPTSVSVRELSATSAFVRTLDRRPVPAGVHLVSITARGDVVVPAPRARLRGATNVVVSVPAVDDHAAAPGSEPVLRAIGTAVDGLPPPCETLSDAVLDAVVPDVIVAGENALGAALTLAGHAAGGTLVR